ncbi:hypothetical protein Tsp_10263 [Trichinella spiralis]|uniref:hypothetical protein n=1 Tax=Trichinella spiralis TaxID=6334 RepID=UPI0001EFDFC4|nr:hypothetical protein Tsp_10263 [Trichinella spiralis]
MRYILFPCLRVRIHWLKGESHHPVCYCILFTRHVHRYQSIWKFGFTAKTLDMSIQTFATVQKPLLRGDSNERIFIQIMSNVSGHNAKLYFFYQVHYQFLYVQQLCTIFMSSPWPYRYPIERLY